MDNGVQASRVEAERSRHTSVRDGLCTFILPPCWGMDEMTSWGPFQMYSSMSPWLIAFMICSLSIQRNKPQNLLKIHILWASWGYCPSILGVLHPDLDSTEETCPCCSLQKGVSFHTQERNQRINLIYVRRERKENGFKWGRKFLYSASSEDKDRKQVTESWWGLLMPFSGFPVLLPHQYKQD